MSAHPAQHYRAYALTLRSELPIQGAVPITADNHDIDIVRGPAILEGRSRTDGPYSLAGDRLLFELPQGSRYLCERGTRIVVDPLSGASDALIEDMLVATALPALLWMRGDFVLHAAAAAGAPGRPAIAIAGRSGEGKSALLQQLLAAGACVVSDDTVRLEIAGSKIWVSGLPARLMRRTPRQVGAPLASDARKAVAVPLERQLERAPLEAIVVLASPGLTATPGFERLQGTHALEALLAHRHRPRVPRLLGTEPSLLAPAAAIASTVPIYLWHRGETSAAASARELAALATGF